MFDRRLVQYFDKGLLLLTLIICGLGLMTLFSAISSGTSPQKILYVKQWIWYGAGFCAMGICIFFDYKIMERWAYVIYCAAVSLLVAVFFFGRFGGGSRRWLVFGPLSLQPSEIAKIAVIIVLARYYSRLIKNEGFSIRDLCYPFILTMIPFGLIVKQPDLGTAMVVFLIAASMTFFTKIEKRSLICLIVICCITAGSGWFFLKDYQRQRIYTFLDPDRDPLGAGYHIIQSKIAIGSGMVNGKGFLKGTQNTLSFLPEQHTDFIFSVLAEEQGFKGALLLIFIFMLLIIWGLNIAYNCRNPFGIILSVGVTAMIFWQAFINLGMVMGLMPVVGVPLPLVSYGGSSVLTIMICIGILMNVSMRRFMAD